MINSSVLENANEACLKMRLTKQEKQRGNDIHLFDDNFPEHKRVASIGHTAFGAILILIKTTNFKLIEIFESDRQIFNVTILFSSSNIS